jgi:hypothetical protein
MSYTIYTLSAPGACIEWRDIRYIGMSIDVFSRFKQHLSRHDDTNPEKTAWIQHLLAQGRTPTLGTIEEVGTREEARKREQYWIRYAMAQGADLLNRAINSTEQERTEVHRRRAMRYASVEKLLARGIYVKREAVWYPSSLLNRYQYSGSQDFHLNILDVFFSTSEGKEVSVFDATDAEFDAFIQQYIPLIDRGQKHWDSFERMNSILFAWFYQSYPNLFKGAREGA